MTLLERGRWSSRVTAGLYYDAAEKVALIHDPLLSPARRSTRPLAFMLHGANQSGPKIALDPSAGGGAYTGGGGREVTVALYRAGFDVIGADHGGEFALGNWDCLDAFDASLAWAEDYGLNVDDLYLVSASGGTLTAQNWMRMRDTFDRVAGWAPTIPAFEVDDIYDRNAFGTAPYLDAAYAPEGWKHYEPIWNSWNFRSDYADVPTKCWYAGNDPAALPAYVEQICAENGWPSNRWSETVGHSWQDLPVDEIVDWLVACHEERNA